MKVQIAAVVAMAFLKIPAIAADVSESCTGPGEAKCRVELPTGISMAYWEAGPKDGEVIIFLHGLTDSARSWAPTMTYLSRYFPKYRTIALDQRGHGETSMPSGENCPDAPKSCFAPIHFAADVRAFMNEMQIEKATLVGHSMGSIVAQQAALDYPGRVTRIVLVATTNSSKDNAVVRDYVLKEPVLGAWKTALAAKGITTPNAIWEASPRDADPKVEEWLAKFWDVDMFADPALLAAIIPETANVKMGTWIGATEALLEFDNSARLASLSVPSLTLWGTQDAIFYRKPDQEGMLAALKQSKAPWYWKQYGRIELPASGAQESDIGHNIQWEVPDAVGNDIAAFLATGQPADSITFMVREGEAWVIKTESGGVIQKGQ